MLLTPRYDGPPIIVVEVRDAGPHPVVQQRRRLEVVLGELSEQEWATPSRCEGWTVQDVVTHLTSTNGFWAVSVAQALAGEPTRYLGAFDPVASPAELVDSTRGTSPEATLEAFRETNDAMLAAFDGLDAQGWSAVGEAPPGHVPLTVVADHALWDCWVHERDVLLPLGRPVVTDDAEIRTCLRYAAALGRGFEVNVGRSVADATVIETDDPAVRIVVSVEDAQVRVHDGDAPEGAPTVRLDAVPLLEMLSIRDAGQPVPPAVAALTAGLAIVFDQVAV